MRGETDLEKEIRELVFRDFTFYELIKNSQQEITLNTFCYIQKTILFVFFCDEVVFLKMAIYIYYSFKYP